MFPNESINPISVSRQAGYEAGWFEGGRLEAGWIEVMGALASLVLHWGGGCRIPGFAGTALGRLWEPCLDGTALGRLQKPWLCWYCTEESVGALALLVLHWGAVGALALLVLHWGGFGSPGTFWWC